MPFARYERMNVHKRERLLLVAAQEFATKGYDLASFNHILEQAQIGKSSAYYYFADKADLFCTVVEACFDQLQLVPDPALLAHLTAENFWASFAAIRERPMHQAQEASWVFGAVRAAEELSPAARQHPALAQLAASIEERLLAGMQMVLQCGQGLGCVRTDVPPELLLAWLRQIDKASDAWLLGHQQPADQAMREHISAQTLRLIQAALAPLTQP